MKNTQFIAFIASVMIANVAIAQQAPKTASAPTPAPTPAPAPASISIKAANYEKYSYFQQKNSNESSTSSEDSVWKKKNNQSNGSFGSSNWTLNDNSMAKSQWEFQLFLVRQELANIRSSYGSGITSQFGMVNHKNTFGSTYTNPEQTQLNNQRYARLIEDERFILDRLAGIPVVNPNVQNNNSTPSTGGNLQSWIETGRNR